ncbi:MULTISPECIES: HAD hydrolase-like protein [Methylobacterium]|uniref:HAD hydrolase-like protein n=1 Tax=Methylobacterium sp. CG08_land_8_20_14_0_20_71_15 TaxID=1975531 RepID=UPI000CAC6E98|nr:MULTISPECIES: HAD hydrolase-like protein [Methylobacterium]PIU04370.1 MAG: HAD family hydrolase [Methylobacterium sp. CG09_land_8_20_14_0_10_71_15]PIU12495.1 MAG: HAD family hydrolase [Methylobacterium sp. CG08_land_8_20_14_0_20_71_15]
MTRANAEDGSGIRLVVLDFDGTLADSYPWFRGVLNGVADRYGFRRVEAGEEDGLRRLSAREIVAHLGIPTWKLPLVARHMRWLAARDAASIPLFSGVGAMLKALDERGIRLFVLSSNAEATVRAVLGPNAARIERFACGTSLSGKAGRLRRLIRASGLPADRVLAVGDETRDHDAARRAGCAFGAAVWGYTRREALAALAPDHLFERPDDIAGALVPVPG